MNTSTRNRFLKTIKLSRPRLVGDRRDHVTAKALSCSGDHRCLTATPIRSSSGMIGTHSHLITPVNLGTFALCLPADRRILLFKPMAHLLWAFLEGPAYWLLGCKTPTCQITTDRPDREPNAKSPFDQLRHRFPCPKAKWQFQLLRAMVHNRFGNLCRLAGKKCSTFGTAFRFGSKRLCTSFPVRFHPLANCLACNTQYLCNFNLFLAVTNCLDRLAPKVFLRHSRKRTSISNIHTYIIYD